MKNDIFSGNKITEIIIFFRKNAPKKNIVKNFKTTKSEKVNVRYGNNWIIKNAY